MIIVRRPENIFSVRGSVQNGTFSGRWHFSFDQYYDPEYIQFGTLRVFNDDTLSPGAVWPLHSHKEIEVVTYCAEGQFRHADEHGRGGVLKKGGVQHTTVGRGMWHSEINNLPDKPLRFIQMWFVPSKPGLKPSVEQKQVEREERTNRILPLVSPDHPEALPIASEARVFSCLLQKGYSVRCPLSSNHGVYLYVLEGGPIQVNGYPVPALGAARIIGEAGFTVAAEGDAELLLADVLLL